LFYPFHLQFLFVDFSSPSVHRYSKQLDGGTRLLRWCMEKIFFNVLDDPGSKLSTHDQTEPFRKRVPQLFIAGSRLFGFQKGTMDIHQPDNEEGI